MADDPHPVDRLVALAAVQKTAEEVSDLAVQLIAGLWCVYTPQGVVAWLQDVIANLERDEAR